MDLGSGVHKILPKPSEAGYKISDAVELTVPSCRFCLVFPLSHSEQGPSISFLWLFFYDIQRMPVAKQQGLCVSSLVFTVYFCFTTNLYSIAWR